MNKLTAILSVSLLTLMGLFITSCSDDEPDVNPPTSPDYELKFLQNNLVIFDENGDAKERIFGAVLDESTPDIVYVGVDDFNEARDIFMSLFAEKTQISDDGLKATLMNKQGTAELKPSLDKGNLIAQADFNVAGLKYVTSMRFIHNSAWPENDGGQNGPELGSQRLMRGWTGHKPGVSDDEMDWFVCIRKATKGKPALLVGITKDKHRIREKEFEQYSGHIPGKSVTDEIYKIISSNFKFFKTAFNAGGRDLLDEDRRYWTCRTNFWGQYCTIRLNSGKWEGHDSGAFPVLFYIYGGTEM